MATKIGTPKKDGSGRGQRANQGRGGCDPTRGTGKGQASPPPARRRNQNK